jgi:hypothetical protein
MKRPLSIVAAGIMAASSVAVSFAPAAAMPRVPAAVESAAPSGIVQVEEPTMYKWFRRQARGNDDWRSRDRPRDSDRYWRNHRGDRHWRYNRYRYHDHDDNFGAGLAVGGILGLATGAIIAAQPRGYAYGGYDGYDAACSRKYRSYDPYSKTYMGYDGYRHRCVLP